MYHDYFAVDLIFHLFVIPKCAPACLSLQLHSFSFSSARVYRHLDFWFFLASTCQYLWSLLLGSLPH